MSFATKPEYTPIHDLQTMLRTVLPKRGLGRDGIYGSETKDAVKQFQKTSGLPESGETDQNTWDTLVKAYDHALVLLAEAEPLNIVLQPNQVLERGSTNLHLYLVQAMLNALSHFYYDMPICGVTGILDDSTSRTLKWLQKAADLPETGELDKQTWQHLAKQYRLMVGDGTGSYPVRRTQAPVSEGK